jgi:thioredoxin 1
MIQYLDKSNFDTTINTNDVVLVDFFADWCGPCKALHPALEELAKEFDGKVVISKINVDKNPELTAQFKSEVFLHCSILKWRNCRYTKRSTEQISNDQ